MSSYSLSPYRQPLPSGTSHSSSSSNGNNKHGISHFFTVARSDRAAANRGEEEDSGEFINHMTSDARNSSYNSYGNLVSSAKPITSSSSTYRSDRDEPKHHGSSLFVKSALVPIQFLLRLDHGKRPVAFREDITGHATNDDQTRYKLFIAGDDVTVRKVAEYKVHDANDGAPVMLLWKNCEGGTINESTSFVFWVSRTSDWSRLIPGRRNVSKLTDSEYREFNEALDSALVSIESCTRQQNSSSSSSSAHLAGSTVKSIRKQEDFTGTQREVHDITDNDEEDDIQIVEPEPNLVFVNSNTKKEYHRIGNEQDSLKVKGVEEEEIEAVVRLGVSRSHIPDFSEQDNEVSFVRHPKFDRQKPVARRSTPPGFTPYSTSPPRRHKKPPIKRAVQKSLSKLSASSNSMTKYTYQDLTNVADDDDVEDDSCKTESNDDEEEEAVGPGKKLDRSNHHNGEHEEDVLGENYRSVRKNSFNRAAVAPGPPVPPPDSIGIVAKRAKLFTGKTVTTTASQSYNIPKRQSAPSGGGAFKPQHFFGSVAIRTRSSSPPSSSSSLSSSTSTPTGALEVETSSMFLRPRRSLPKSLAVELMDDADGPPLKKKKRQEGGGNEEEEGETNDEEELNRVLFVYPEGSQDSVVITVRDVLKCSEDVFLNDSLIDFYLKYQKFNTVEEVKSSLFHVFTSFLYTRMIDGIKSSDRRSVLMSEPNRVTTEVAQARYRAYSQVRRWTLGVDLFATSCIIFPINAGLHWSFAACCFQGYSEEGKPPEGLIFTFDSLGCHDPKPIAALIRVYLNHEYESRVLQKIELKVRLPQQSTNNLDDSEPRTPNQDEDDDDFFPEVLENYSSKNDGQAEASSFFELSKNHFDETNLPLHVVKVPRQNDGVNCGIHVLNNASKLLKLISSGFPEGVLDMSLLTEAVDREYASFSFETKEANKLRMQIKEDIAAVDEAFKGTAKQAREPAQKKQSSG